MARYVDAEALTERLRLQFCKDCNSYIGVRCRSCDIDDTIDFIEDAPTADVVESKHGEWEEQRTIFMDNEITLGFRCTACDLTSSAQSLYCPNCGAKMDGGKKE